MPPAANGKKRAAPEAPASADLDPEVLFVESPENTSSSSRGGAKSAKTLSDAVVGECLCPITHEVMGDPVTPEDGHTYDRVAITKWLETHSTSPLDPGTQITVQGLRPNHSMRKTLERLMESGDIDASVREAWLASQKKVNLAKAQVFFDEGRVLEAAQLGLPEAQGVMAERYYFGKDGVAKDLDQCLQLGQEGGRGRRLERAV